MFKKMVEKNKEPGTEGYQDNDNKTMQYLRDISIWLDSYEDIFSDFDPRPFSERTLSDDFIAEVNKVCRESEFNINQLKLLLPEKVRNKETENVIVKRLHAHFRKNLQRFSDERKQIIRKAILFFTFGSVLMSLATYFTGLRSKNIWFSILFVLMEPAGWFMVWMALDNIFTNLNKKKTDSDLYTKMGKSRIEFISI